MTFQRETSIPGLMCIITLTHHREVGLLIHKHLGEERQGPVTILIFSVFEKGVWHQGKSGEKNFNLIWKTLPRRNCLLFWLLRWWLYQMPFPDSTLRRQSSGLHLFIYPKNIYYACLCQKLLPKNTQKWKHLEKNILLAKSTRKSLNTVTPNTVFKRGKKTRNCHLLSLHWPVHNKKTATSQHKEGIFCSSGVYFLVSICLLTLACEVLRDKGRKTKWCFSFPHSLLVDKFPPCRTLWTT